MEEKPSLETQTEPKEDPADQDETKEDELTDEQISAAKLGYFSYRPDYLQFFNSPRWLLALLCFYAVVVNIELLGFRGVVVPQIERRFNMTSTLVGSIMSTVDISGAVCGVLLTYYVGQRHKSKWIGYGIIILSFGSFIFMLPHFIAGEYFFPDQSASNNTQTNPLCRLNSSGLHSDPSLCTSQVQQSTPAVVYPVLFVLGLVFCGIGYSIQYNVGLAYLDESISPTISPVYIAFFHMVATIGPTLGFVIGGVFSNIYIDWPSISKGLLPNDPRWIGAWWLGYLIIGCITLITSVFIFAYPYHLPTYKKCLKQRLALAKAANISQDDKKYGKRWADFPRAFYEIVSNRIFLLAVIGLSIDQIPAIGLTTFLPKYLQSQTGASLLTATTLTGATVVISAAVGQIGSGIIMKRWNLVGSKISRFCFYACIINAISSLIFLVSCENPKIAGVYVPYPSPTNVTMHSQAAASIHQTVTCNAMCHCDNSAFNPVCGANGMAYQSPCHAGCNSLIPGANTRALNYTMCSCISSATEKVARTGLCSNEVCSLMVPLLIGIMFMVVCTYITFTPTITIILRSIPQSQTTFGMGVEGLIFRIVGGLLGPIIYGFVMDSSCILWKEECGQRQFCWLYENGNLALYVFTATAICKGVKLGVYTLLWYYHKKLDTPDEKEKVALPEDTNKDEKEAVKVSVEGQEVMKDNLESQV